MLLLLKKGIVYLPDQGIVGNIQLTTLSELGAEIGPDRHQIHATFNVSGTTVGSIYKAFWGYDSSITKTISQKPNAYLEPKDAEQARALWNKRGKLLIVERARLNTYTVLATYLDEAVLSNVWWPVKVEDDAAKILAIWINSTFGLLLLLSIAEVTQGPWVQFKKEYLWEMPVLNVERLSCETKTNFLNSYERIKESELKALSKEFANPSTRKAIDDEICKNLGLELKLDSLYELLSKEPMLTG